MRFSVRVYEICVVWDNERCDICEIQKSLSVRELKHSLGVQVLLRLHSLVIYKCRNFPYITYWYKILRGYHINGQCFIYCTKTYSGQSWSCNIEDWCCPGVNAIREERLFLYTLQTWNGPQLRCLVQNKFSDVDNMCYLFIFFFLLLFSHRKMFSQYSRTCNWLVSYHCAVMRETACMTGHRSKWRPQWKSISMYRHEGRRK